MAFPDIKIPEYSIIELPKIAQFMSSNELGQKLTAVNFKERLEDEFGFLVSDDFGAMAKVPINRLYDASGELIGFTAEEWMSIFDSQRQAQDLKSKITIDSQL